MGYLCRVPRKVVEAELGVGNCNDYGARWYDASIGRFTGVDPIADKYAWVSPYNYAENEPVGHIDLWGLQKADPVMSGGAISEVTVTATSGYHDQSVPRYGYSGDWEQYQHEFGLEGWAYDNALNYWNSVYADDFAARVAWLDKDQDAREDVAMMLQFVKFFEMMATTVALGGPAAHPLPRVKGFNYNYTSLKSENWIAVNTTRIPKDALHLEMNPEIKSSEFYKLMNPSWSGSNFPAGFTSTNGIKWQFYKGGTTNTSGYTIKGLTPNKQYIMLRFSQ